MNQILWNILGEIRMFREITIEKANKITIENLRLDSESLNLSSVEGIAGVIRKVSGFKCPCSTKELNDFSESLLKELIPESELNKISDIVDSMISYGDLLEQSSREDASRKVLYGSSPAFVRINNTVVLLLGIVPEGFPPLPHSLISKIEFINHVRKLTNLSEKEIGSIKESGLQEFPCTYWLKSPQKEHPKDFLKKIDREIEKMPKDPITEDVEIIDIESKVDFYKSRWKKLKPSISGKFIARRKRKYGNFIWSYIKVKDGGMKRKDLPFSFQYQRGCDEAWRIQMALDYLNEHPQVFSIENISQDKIIIDFFSPIPRWASRKWDVLGNPVPGRKALFSYCFAGNNAIQEVEYCKKMLWMTERSR